jgi:hypothetical protein
MNSNDQTSLYLNLALLSFSLRFHCIRSRVSHENASDSGVGELRQYVYNTAANTTVLSDEYLTDLASAFVLTTTLPVSVNNRSPPFRQRLSCFPYSQNAASQGEAAFQEYQIGVDI